jgi:ribosome maturation factor RimP
MARLDQELTARLERLAASEGVELCAVEVMGTARKPIVRLVLDREVGGVSLADCENVSRQASVLLDAYDPFPSAFTLEVTSPGLDRKLYHDKDYARFAGQPVRVRMRPGYPAPRLFDGALEGKADGVVRVRDDKGVLHELPASELLDVRLAPFSRVAEAQKKHSGRKQQR